MSMRLFPQCAPLKYPPVPEGSDAMVPPSISLVTGYGILVIQNDMSVKTCG
jgi:hypothetical protein